MTQNTGQDCTERLLAMSRRFALRAAAHDRSGQIAFENLAELREAGLLSLTVPASHGGAGAGLRRVVEVIAIIARGDPSTALILAMQYLQTAGIARSQTWDEAAKSAVFESILHQGALINALRVEPELGTPARGGLPATKLRLQDGQWRVSGRKIFSTGSHALDWGVVFAATEDDEPRVAQVLVPLRSPGVEIEESWHQLGMRATGSHTVVFDAVAVPSAAFVNLGDAASGRQEIVALAAWHVLAVVAIYDSVARAARDWFVSYLQNRVPSNLGHSLAELPRFHGLLGEIDALLLANRGLIEWGIANEEAGNAIGTDGGLLKHVVTENAISAIGKMVAAIGNPALSQDNPLERHYRDVLCGRIHTPQADVALAASGRAALI